MSLNHSTLGDPFFLAKANTAKTQSSQYDIVRDKFPLLASLKFVIDSNCTQIDSPSRLPATLLHSYINGKRKVVLLSRDKNVYPATLASVTETDLSVELKYSAVAKLAQRRQPILIVFSGEGDRKYILQTGLSEAYAFSLQLTYRDPRYDTRLLAKLAEPGVIHALSCTKRLELVAEQLEPVREITWLTPGKGSKQIVQIEDTLRVPDSDILHRPQDYVDADTRKQAVVHDLSLGGTRLVLDEPLHDPADKQLLQIKLEFPPTEISGQNTTLNILSLLAASHRVDSKVHLHCRFIWRLPDDLVTLFEHLPQQ